MKRVLGWAICLTIIVACNNDDGIDGEVVPPRLLSEVAPEDDATIKTFLDTHFYNYEDFQPPIDPNFDYRVVVDTIAGDNSNKIPLSQQVQSGTFNVSAVEFSLSDGEVDIPHTYYYLVAREGEGERATYADSTFVSYEGTDLDGNVFDTATGSGRWFDLQGTFNIPGTVTGFQIAMENFKDGNGVIEMPDGTFEVQGFGSGLIIMPSGLGYFNGTQAGSAYLPIMFNINLYETNQADHDRDGIVSIMEDVNGNEDLFDDDTDGDAIPDYIDIDDDNDGTFTFEEITDEDGNIIFPYPDTDGDGIPDYLDPDNS